MVVCPRCRHEHPPRQCPRVLVVVPLEHRLAEIARLNGATVAQMEERRHRPPSGGGWSEDAGSNPAGGEP